MERAHRTGQRRAVNVYRVVARGTIEESILGLRHFKRSVAEGVVVADSGKEKSEDGEAVSFIPFPFSSLDSSDRINAHNAISLYSYVLTTALTS